MTSNDRTDPRTKHIDVKYHFTREVVKNAQVTITYKTTQEMLADALNKPVAGPKFLWFRDKIGVQQFTPDVQLRGRVGNHNSSHVSNCTSIDFEGNIRKCATDFPSPMLLEHSKH